MQVFVVNERCDTLHELNLESTAHRTASVLMVLAALLKPIKLRASNHIKFGSLLLILLVSISMRHYNWVWYFGGVHALHPGWDTAAKPHILQECGSSLHLHHADSYLQGMRSVSLRD